MARLRHFVPFRTLSQAGIPILIFSPEEFPPRERRSSVIF